MINMAHYEDEFDSLVGGETRRLDHDNCPAGEDTRRRLYLTRPASSTGVVLGYCHNCAESGVWRDGGHQFRDTHSKQADDDQSSVDLDFSVPENMVRNSNLWPAAAYKWRIENGLSREDCYHACIQYDPASHRIYMPQYDKVNSLGLPLGTSELLGFQLRRLEDGFGSKYLNAMRDSSTKPYTRFNPQELRSLKQPAIGKGCVLVEDLVSAIHLTKATPYISVVVNYGVKVSPEILDDNSDCDKNLVWLDNDNGKVCENAEVIRRTWSLISGKPTSRMEHRIDPKHYKEEELKKVITRWIQSTPTS